MIKALAISIIFTATIFAQNAGPEYITVSGDSLVGKVLNGEAVREVYGNVVLNQGNITITCKKAIQFILRNNAELMGNVIVVQENLTITTERGFYNGNLKQAETKSKVRLDDKKVILTADIGDYYFNEDRAYFQDNVMLFDTTSTLTSNVLNYYKNQNRAVATGKVKIIDSENIITADDLSERIRTVRLSVEKPSTEEDGISIKEKLRQYEAELILNALKAHQWNQTKTAGQLDIERTYLIKLIRELGIDYKKKRYF